MAFSNLFPPLSDHLHGRNSFLRPTTAAASAASAALKKRYAAGNGSIGKEWRKWLGVPSVVMEEEPVKEAMVRLVTNGKQGAGGKENAGSMESSKRRKKKPEKMDADDDDDDAASLIRHRPDTTQSSPILLPLLTADRRLDQQPFLQIRRVLESKPVNAAAANQAAMAESLGLHQIKIKRSPTKSEEEEEEDWRAHIHQTKPSRKKNGYGYGTDPRLSNANSEQAMESSVCNPIELGLAALDHGTLRLRQRSSSGTAAVDNHGIHGDYAENQRRKSISVVHSIHGHVAAGSMNRPPWWSFTAISDARPRATIAERVMPQTEGMSQTVPGIAMPLKKKNQSEAHCAGEGVEEDRGMLYSAGALQRSSAPAMAKKLELSDREEGEEDQEAEQASSEKQTDEQAQISSNRIVAIARSDSEKEMKPNRKKKMMICVDDLRPISDRPWRISPPRSKPSIRVPLNHPVCKKPYLSSSSPPPPPPPPSSSAASASGYGGGYGITGNSVKASLSAQHRLSPFKSFQLQPLKLGDCHPCERRLVPSATIRPYVSPSKNAIATLKLQEEEEEEGNSLSSDYLYAIAKLHSEYNKKLCRSKRSEYVNPNSYSSSCRHYVQKKQPPSSPSLSLVQNLSPFSSHLLQNRSSSPLSLRRVARSDSVVLEPPPVWKLPSPAPSMIPSLPSRNNYKKKSASSIDSSVRSCSTHSTFGQNNMAMAIKLPSRSYSVAKSSLGFDQSINSNSMNDLVAKKKKEKEKEKEAMRKKLDKVKHKEEMNCEALIAGVDGGWRRRGRSSAIVSIRPPSLMDYI